jgi:hypothetical protein
MTAAFRRMSVVLEASTDQLWRQLESVLAPGRLEGRDDYLDALAWNLWHLRPDDYQTRVDTDPNMS